MRIGLVKDINSIAAKSPSRSYERAVKIRNIKNMADTLMYLEDHGYKNLDELYAKHDDQRKKLTAIRKALVIVFLTVLV